MVNKKITVILADDHPLVREGIRHFLEKSSEIKVIGEASDGREAVDLVLKLTPDVLLLDLEMPVMDGLEVLELLIRQKCPVRILLVTAMNDPIYIQEVIHRGAWGYFCKGDPPKALVDTVLKARGGVAI